MHIQGMKRRPLRAWHGTVATQPPLSLPLGPPPPPTYPLPTPYLSRNVHPLPLALFVPVSPISAAVQSLTALPNSRNKAERESEAPTLSTFTRVDENIRNEGSAKVLQPRRVV